MVTVGWGWSWQDGTGNVLVTSWAALELVAARLVTSRTALESVLAVVGEKWGCVDAGMAVVVKV